MISVADARISLATPLIAETTIDKGLAGAPSSATEAQWAPLLEELQRLRDLEDDWDGQGARALEPANVDHAAAWIKEMRRWRHAMPPTRVSPGTLGEVIVEWRGESFHLVAEIGSPTLVEWLLNLQGQPLRQWQTDARCAWIIRSET